MSLTIDSTTYNVPVKVMSRKADMLYKYAERTEDGNLKSELIGVYFNYDLQCGKSLHNTTAYTALWQKLTEPDDTHTITVPDEDGTVTYSCYFANIKDEVDKEGSTNYFSNLSFSAIARGPARTP